MAGDTTVFDLAGLLLDVVRDYYAANGLDLPLRQYVSAGVEAVDCEQMTCRAVRTFPIGGDATEERVVRFRAFNRRGAEFALTIIRCVPVVSDNGTPPSVEREEASARDIFTDAETVTLAVIDAYENGDLPGCGGVAFTGWTSYGPEGGYGGGTSTLAVVLD